MIRQIKKEVYEYFILGLLYAGLYMFIELVYRGYTHYSMGILAFCVSLTVVNINNFTSKKPSLILQGFFGACIATVGEYLFGLIFNRDYSIWCYSHLPLNFQGQICLVFFFIWFALSILLIIIDDYLKFRLFHKEKPKYKWF